MLTDESLTEEDIRRNIKDAVKKFDKELPYNPVGGDIMVETWKPKRYM